MAHLNLWGNAFVGKYRDGDGRVAQLGAAAARDASTVKLERGAAGLHRLQPREGVERYGREDVLHVRAPLSERRPDRPLADPPGPPASLSLSRALPRHALDTMRRGARLSGVLTTPADVVVDPDDVERDPDADRVQSWVGDGEQRRGSRFVTGGLDLLAAVDAARRRAVHRAARSSRRAEICRIFRVPPWMIGAPSGDSHDLRERRERRRRRS